MRHSEDYYWTAEQRAWANNYLKELDELKEKCVQAMKDVDAFVDEHYEDLIAEMKSQHHLPYYWEARIVSNCGVVHGCFRQSDKDEWTNVIYNDGEWLPLHDSF